MRVAPVGRPIGSEKGAGGEGEVDWFEMTPTVVSLCEERERGEHLTDESLTRERRTLDRSRCKPSPPVRATSPSQPSRPSLHPC